MSAREELERILKRKETDEDISWYRRKAQAILDAGFVKFRNTDLMSVKIEEDKIIITITPQLKEKD